VVLLAYDSTLNNFVDMGQASLKAFNARGPDRATKQFRTALTKIIPSKLQETGNVFHVKHDSKKFQHGVLTSVGTTDYQTVNAASEPITLDRGNSMYC